MLWWAEERALSLIRDPDVEARVARLGLPFNEDGFDPYGVSRRDLVWMGSIIAWLYRRYFRVRAHGLEHIPATGRAMLVGNHSGGVAFDGLMVIGSALLDKEPPRLAQGMVEKFINRFPFGAKWSSRAGQMTGLPEHAERLLRDDRLLMVFPEGARGTAKLYWERHSLVRFGTGFVRLALATNTPIVPFAVVGGGEAFPTIANLYRIGRTFGVPYLPVTPYLAPVPLPVPLVIRYGEPIHLGGRADEDDAHVEAQVDEIKARIARLIEAGRADRKALT